MLTLIFHALQQNFWLELAWRSGYVMDCHAMTSGSIPSGDGVKTKLMGAWSLNDMAVDGTLNTTNQPTNITLGNTGIFTDGWCNNFTLNSTTFLNYFSSLRTGDMSRCYEKGLSCKRHLVGENEQELCYLSQEEITRWQHWYIAPCP